MCAGVTWVLRLRTYLPDFFETGFLSESWDLLSGLGWLLSKPLGSSCFRLSNVGIMSKYASEPAFFMCAGERAQGLVVVVVETSPTKSSLPHLESSLKPSSRFQSATANTYKEHI